MTDAAKAAKESLQKTQTNNAIAKHLTNEEKILGLIESSKHQIERALPNIGIDANRFTRLCLTSLRRNPKLLSCTPHSLLASMMTCAQLGLEPDTPLAQAHIIPYGNEATFLIGYKGLRELAMRTGKVKKIYANAVYEGDEFDWSHGTGENEYLKHKEKKQNTQSIYWYAMATLDNGEVMFDVMSRKEVDVIRAGAKAKGASAWTDHYDEMGKKTVTRRLCKQLPMSSELSRAVELDELLEHRGPQGLKISDEGEIQHASFDEPIEKKPIEGEEKAIVVETEDPAVTLKKETESRTEEFKKELSELKNEDQAIALGLRMRDALNTGKITEQQAAELGHIMVAWNTAQSKKVQKNDKKA